MPRTCGAGWRRLALAGAAVSIVVALAACAGGSRPTPTPSVPTVPVETPVPTPTVEPTLDPNGDAAQAREMFDAANGRTLVRNPDATGAEFVDGLVAAGFDKAVIEMTADKTSVGLDAGSIQFAVRWGDQCLLGQSGEGSDGYRSMTAPVLATGKCLIGQTVPLG